MYFVPGCGCCEPCPGRICYAGIIGCGGYGGTGDTGPAVPADHGFHVVIEDLTDAETVYDYLDVGGPVCLDAIGHHEYRITIEKARYKTLVWEWKQPCGDYNLFISYLSPYIAMSPADGYACSWCCSVPVPRTLYLDDGHGIVTLTRDDPLGTLNIGYWTGEAVRTGRGCVRFAPDPYESFSACDPDCTWETMTDIAFPCQFSWGVGPGADPVCGAGVNLPMCVTTYEYDNPPYGPEFFDICVPTDSWHDTPGPCESEGDAIPRCVTGVGASGALPVCAPLHWEGTVAYFETSFAPCLADVWPEGSEWTVDE